MTDIIAGDTRSRIGATSPSGYDKHGEPPAQRGWFWRLGAGAARWRWLVVAAWLVVVVGATVFSGALNAAFDAAVRLPNSPAQTGADLLSSHNPQPVGAAATQSGTIVYHSTPGSLVHHRSAIEQATSAVRALPGVDSVSDPFSILARDGSTAIATITYNSSVTSLSPADITATDNAVRPAMDGGVAVDYGGDLGSASVSSLNGLSELVGVGAAILVLLFAFGSVLATVIPVVSALVGVFTGIGILGIVCAWTTLPSESPTLALMMGLGVGIDYALFLTSRFRQALLDGSALREAVASTVASSGRAVVIAAITVVIALAGLYASGITYVGQLGLSAGVVVAVAATAAVTLVPALLAIAGNRIDIAKVRRHPVAEPGGTRNGWWRYAEGLRRHPLRYLVAAVALLAILAIPVLSIRLGTSGTDALPTQNTERQASQAVAAAFGPGYQSPLNIIVEVPPGSTDAQLASTAAELRSALKATTGVASASPMQPTPDRQLLVGKVIATTPGTADETASLITQLQDTVLPAHLPASDRGYVTGAPALSLGLRSAITATLPLTLAVVVLAAMLLILVTFRSPLLALKAGVINLLSIGASYGVLVAVFQWGWGSQLIGIPQGIPIVSFVPTLMFAIVFGLSMDYEVFLLARIAEARLRGETNAASVASGLSTTGRIISSAALIMACVFFSFLFAGSVTIKMLGLGLGVSVLIDATIVRLVIVPCAMYLFGPANWWTPAWLDRLLPKIQHDPS